MEKCYSFATVHERFLSEKNQFWKDEIQGKMYVKFEKQFASIKFMVVKKRQFRRY